MRSLLFVSSLLLVGCGSNLDPSKSIDPRTVSHDPTFNSYIETYIAQKGAPLDYDIPIAFTHIEGQTIGICTRWSNGYRQIEIDKEYWDSASERYRLSLISHELGHCDLLREHSPDILSIMYYQNWGSLDFSELFGRKTVNAKLSFAQHDYLNQDDHCVRDIEVE